MKDFIKSSIDRIELYNEPYFYGLCDNFLPEDLLESLFNISSDIKKWPVPGNGGHSKYKHVESCNIFNDYMDAWKQTELMKLILDKFDVTLDCWRRKYDVNSCDDLRVIYSFRKQGPGFEYMPHTDIPTKGISIVVFIYPDNADKYLTHNLGTIMYKPEDEVIDTDSKGRNIRYSYYGAIRWERNRAFIISVISNQTKELNRRTWHSYHVPEYITQGRATLMINIIPITSENP